MNCKNCKELLSGNFCSHCGQDASVGKITAPKLLNELSESIFQLDRGLFFTLKELFINPGQSIQGFLDGRRKNHFKPIAYALFFSTVYFLISKVTHQNTWMNDFILGFTEGAYDSGENMEMLKIVTWFTNNYAYTTLLLIPVFSFTSYLSFSKSGSNYLEHIVLNCYITGQQAIFYSFFCLLMTVIDCEFLETLPVIVAISYCFWVFLQFFKEKNRTANILRSLLTYILFLIFSTGALFLMMAIQDFVL